MVRKNLFGSKTFFNKKIIILVLLFVGVSWFYFNRSRFRDTASIKDVQPNTNEIALEIIFSVKDVLNRVKNSNNITIPEDTYNPTISLTTNSGGTVTVKFGVWQMSYADKLSAYNFVLEQFNALYNVTGTIYAFDVPNLESII